MPHILKNDTLELHIDTPFENYNFSRFDWTGKITKVKFKNIHLSGTERTDVNNVHSFGQGFYNEFGIEKALGFDEAELGGWFHKIGVGLLKKEDSTYHLSKTYKIKPAQFNHNIEPNKILMCCKSKQVNGYAYILRKEIVIHQSSFSINYYLENTGEKDIITTEYAHNFIAINKEDIDLNYKLKFPFQIKPELFGETLNPDLKVTIGDKEIAFNNAPQAPFFFSNLSGHETTDAAWELTHHAHNIGIRETGNFQTKKINLWGSQHVICPELFFSISIQPGESKTWSRNFKMYNLT